MGIYEELGIRPILNANATLTRLGGSRLAPAMASATNGLPMESQALIAGRPSAQSSFRRFPLIP